MGEPGADAHAGSEVPEADRSIHAYGQKRLAVRAEADREHGLLVLQGRLQWLTCCGIPQPGGLVVASCRQGLAVGAEGDSANRSMPDGSAARFSSGQIPNLD